MNKKEKVMIGSSFLILLGITIFQKINYKRRFEEINLLQDMNLKMQENKNKKINYELEEIRDEVSTVYEHLEELVKIKEKEV